MSILATKPGWIILGSVIRHTPKGKVFLPVDSKHETHVRDNGKTRRIVNSVEEAEYFIRGEPHHD